MEYYDDEEQELMRDDRAAAIWKLYDEGRTYQASVGLAEDVPRFTDFLQGKQWAPAQEGTENMPRMVFNIVKLIVRNKKSNILSVPCRLVYKSDSRPDIAQMLTDFAAFETAKMRMKEIDAQAVEDGAVTGSYFYHFFYDAEKGRVDCELIDILNIFFANPQEEDEQRQKWILISSREEVETVRGYADEDCDVTQITADESDSKYGDVEQEGLKLCTVLTRYFKQDGEVLCEKVTKGCVVKKAFSLTPFNETGEKMTLYPIVAGSYDRRKNSIYGLGEIESLIPNQKTINVMASMQAYNVMMNSWGKWKVTEDALRGQEITGEAGQVLTDYSKTGNGISRIPEAGFSNAPSEALDKVVSMTRNMVGASEVLAGEVLGANMSGSAIAQLQAQANQPIEELRNRFWRVKEKQGAILEQFFKLYYGAAVYSVEENGEKRQGMFDSAAVRGTDFTVAVEATSGTRSSAASDIVFLESLLRSGTITATEFVRLYPADAISNKDNVLKILEQREADELTQLRAKIKSHEANYANATALIEKQAKIIDEIMPVVKENRALKAEFLQMYLQLQGGGVHPQAINQNTQE